MTTILVTGSSGQLGSEIRELSTRYSGYEFIFTDTGELDITDAGATAAFIKSADPSWIINCAAYTAVDKAESEPEIACAINAIAPKVLAAQANLLHIPIIHYSTDYVFDGTKDGIYSEDDPANPQSIYGKTKWLGEKNVRAMCPQHVILRTSWVFGAHGGNFLKTILKLSQEREELKIIADQFGAPTSAKLLADSTAKIAKQILQDGVEGKAGTYHLVAAGETTWHAYTKKVIATANALGIETKIRPDAIQAIPTDVYPLPAPRPRNSRLNTKKIQETFGIEIPDWSFDVEHVLKQITA